MITKTKLTVEIELERDEEEEYPSFATVSRVKVNGKEVIPDTGGMLRDGCEYDLKGIDDGYMIMLKTGRY